MNQIKIFLASSNELQDIRDKIKSEIEDKNKIWKNFNFDLYRWEEETARIFKYGLQEEYNINIKDADVFILLGKTKMGKFTQEEFDVAFNQFVSTDKPFLFTYFQKINTEPEESLKEFVKKLDSLNHYKSPFDDFNDLWIKLNKELDRLLADNFAENKFDASKLDNTYFINKFIQNITHNYYSYGEKKIPKELTPSPIPSSVFVGREDRLIELHKIFFESAGNKARVIRGIGGVGKTTFARHYYHKFQNQYRHIAWIDYLGNLRDSFISNNDIKNSLKIEEEIKGKSADEIFSIITSELRTIGNEELNLLVIDNVENYDEADFKKINMSGWHLLLTSREKVSVNMEEFNLDVLKKDDAFKMFRQLCPDNLTDAEVNKLLDGIGNHTLMIEILAKHSNEYTDTSFDELNNAIPKSLNTYIKISRENKAIENILEFLKSIFKITNLSEPEKKILKQFTAMPSFAINLEERKKLLIGLDKKLEINLKKLSDKGWLQKESSNYKMHQLIQQVLRAEFSPTEEDLKELINNLTELLRVDQSKDNPVEKFKWVLFGDSILELFPVSETQEISLLRNNLATIYRYFGKYEKARDLFEKSLKSSLRNFGENDPRVTVYQTNLGSVYLALGEYRKAHNLFVKALLSDLENFGESDPKVAVNNSNLALVLKVFGEYEIARGLLEKALQSDLINFGENDPLVAIRRSNLAELYYNLREFEKARDLFEKALDSDLRNFGENHPNIARIQNNLSFVCRDLGDNEKALDLLEKSLKSSLRNFGENHPDVAMCQYNLAAIYIALNKRVEALKLLESAYTIFLNLLGKEHQNTKAVKTWIDKYGDK